MNIVVVVVETQTLKVQLGDVAGWARELGSREGIHAPAFVGSAWACLLSDWLLTVADHHHLRPVEFVVESLRGQVTPLAWPEGEVLRIWMDGDETLERRAHCGGLAGGLSSTSAVTPRVLAKARSCNQSTGTAFSHL